MSDSTYLDIYSLTGDDAPKADIDGLRASVEKRILEALGAEELPAQLLERLDAEIAWTRSSGTLSSWLALAQIAEVARQKRIPLGAPLGSADGTLIGSALCSLPLTVAHLRSLDEVPAPVPPGVEVPGERRDELLQAIASGASWTGWTEDGPQDGRTALWLRPSHALSLLDAVMSMSARHTSAGFSPEAISASLWPQLSENALVLLKKADVAGIEHISAAALKGWKGNASLESMGALVARSMASGGDIKPPDGIAAWGEHTGDTGGALLYYDQFARIVEVTAGISANGAAALRLAMLNGQADAEGALHARFIAGCTLNSIAEQSADALWKTLANVAPGLVSRQVAYAWAQIAVWCAEVKTSHPAAFFAAALDIAWERGGRAGIRPLVENARRLGVTLLPPDVIHSEGGTALESVGDGWAIRWGLGFLPGWEQVVAERFIETRGRAGDCATLSGLAKVMAESDLSPLQTEALVRSGACDKVGGREGLMETLPAAVEWARTNAQAESSGAMGAGTGTYPYDAVKPEPAVGPRLRFARRTWEEQNLGVAFTDAHEIDDLRLAVSASRGLSGSLTSSAGIGPEQVGQSVCLVGLLHDVRLLEVEGTANESKSKNGDKLVDGQHMAVTWVEDLDGAIELVAFPPSYKRHQELWVENNLAIITARVCLHAGNEGVYLLCEHLAAYHAETADEELNIIIKSPRRSATSTAPLPSPDTSNTNGGSYRPDSITQTAPTHTTSIEIRNPQSKIQNPVEPPTYQLIITLPMSVDAHEDIDRMIALDKLFRAHEGSDTVTLRIPYSPEPGAVTSAQLPRRVRYSWNLEEAVRRLLGPDALALIKLLG